MKSTKKATNKATKAAKKGISKLGLVGIIIVLIIAVTLVALAYSPVGKSLAEKIQKGSTPTTEVEILASNFEPITIGDAKLKVHFIDVKQGDAIYIELPDGKDMLIDGGSGVIASDEVKTKFESYLANIKGTNEKIDHLVVTHPDTDHYNMLESILENYEVQNIYYNDVNKNATYSGYMDLFEEEGATLHKAGPSKTQSVWRTIVTDTYTLEMYSIGYDTLNVEKVDKYDASESNGMSIVTTLKYKDRKVVLTGDAIEATEEWLLPLLEDGYDCDVLKLGHHGSSTSTSEEFLDKIKPEFAIVSADNGKAHDHPRPTVMNRLYDRGIITYSTNHHGSIVLEIAEDGKFGFRTEKAAMVQNNTKARDPLYIAPAA